MATEPPRASRRGRALPLTPRQFVALVVLVLAFAFVLQNRDDVSVNILTVDVTSPLWLLLVIMLAIGAALGVLLTRRRA